MLDSPSGCRAQNPTRMLQAPVAPCLLRTTTNTLIGCAQFPLLFRQDMEKITF